MLSIHSFFHSTNRAVASPLVFASLRKRGLLAALRGILAVILGGTCVGVHAQSAYFAGTQKVIANGLNHPYPVAVDGRGNVLIADTSNSRVIEVDSSGGNFGTVNVGSTSTTPISTNFHFYAAGTLGSIAVLTQGATGMDFANAGTGTCTAGTAYAVGAICTVDVSFSPKFAGTRYGAAELLDSSGKVLATGYVQGTGVGPQVNFLPGAEITIAPDLAWAGGIAVDGNGTVYVSDNSTPYLLYKETLSEGVYTQSTVPTSALSDPYGVAVDGSGSIYIADSSHWRVLKETPAADGYTERAVASFAAIDGSAPTGVAVDGSGNVYVTLCCDVGAVYKETLTTAGYIQSTVVSGLPSATGVAVDGSGDVYIAVNETNDGIVKETPSANGYIQSTIPVGGAVGLPFGVAVDGSGNVYIVFIDSNDNGQVFEETPTAGGYIQSTIQTSKLNQPMAVAVDSSGNVYIGNSGYHSILKEDLADAPSLRFANTVIGLTSSDSPQTVTLENIGNAPLSFPVPTSGNNPNIPADFTLDSSGESACPLVESSSSSPGTLAAGESCLLAISFSPTSLGSLSGTLVLTDNALNVSGSTQSILLNGTGIAALPPVLISPTPGSTLSGPSATFTWNAAASGNQGYWLFLGTTGAGSKNLYDSGQQTATSATFSNLPTDGATIYARVYTRYNGVLVYNDYTYTAWSEPPVMTSPAAGSTLPGTSATFTWTAAGSNNQGYWLFLGTTGLGSKNLYDSGQQTATSATFSNLPTNGATIYARLYTRYNGVLVYNDYTYKAAAQAVLTTPTPGSSFTNASVTFGWTAATGSGNQGYWLFLGTTGVGSKNLYDSGQLTATSVTVNNLPTSGVTIYARLYTRYNGTFVYKDYPYIAK